MPSAIIGSGAGLATGRWWPFFLGVALTFLPLILAVLLAEPEPGFEAATD